MIKDCWNCKHRDGVLFVDNTICNECRRDHFLWEARTEIADLTEKEVRNWLVSIDNAHKLMEKPIPDRVIFNDPATIIIWKDGSKTVVKCMEGDEFDPEKGFAMCYLKKVLGKDYGSTMRKYVKPELKKREEPGVTTFTFTGVKADNIQEAMQKLGMVIDQQTGYKAKHDKAKEQKNG